MKAKACLPTHLEQWRNLTTSSLMKFNPSAFALFAQNFCSIATTCEAKEGEDKKKKRDETYYSPQEKEITVFESYKEKTNIYSVISSVYGI